MTIISNNPAPPNGAWVTGCPTCGRYIMQKNLTYYFEYAEGYPKDDLIDGKCDNCDDWDKQVRNNTFDNFGDELEPTVIAELKGCGCGAHELVDDDMYKFLKGTQTHMDYLHSRPFSFDYQSDEGAPPRFPYGFSESHAYLLAYIADILEWTSHGGSVGGCWLTEDGKKVLAILESRYGDKERELND